MHNLSRPTTTSRTQRSHRLRGRFPARGVDSCFRHFPRHSAQVPTAFGEEGLPTSQPVEGGISWQAGEYDREGGEIHARGWSRRRKNWNQLTGSRDRLGRGDAGVLERGPHSLSEDGGLQSEPLRGRGRRWSGRGGSAAAASGTRGSGATGPPWGKGKWCRGGGRRAPHPTLDAEPAAGGARAGASPASREGKSPRAPDSGALLYPSPRREDLEPQGQGEGRVVLSGPQPPAVQESRLPSPQAAGQVPVVGPRHPHPPAPLRFWVTVAQGPAVFSPTPLFASFSGFLPTMVPPLHSAHPYAAQSLFLWARSPLGSQPSGLRPPDSLSSS